MICSVYFLTYFGFFQCLTLFFFKDEIDLLDEFLLPLDKQEDEGDLGEKKLF